MNSPWCYCTFFLQYAVDLLFIWYEGSGWVNMVKNNANFGYFMSTFASSIIESFFFILRALHNRSEIAMVNVVTILCLTLKVGSESVLKVCLTGGT